MNIFFKHPGTRSQGGKHFRLYQRSAALLIISLFILPACKKEKDDRGPKVTILSPGSSAKLVVPGFITVRAEVSDENIVRTVSFGLFDGNGIPIGQGQSATVDASSAIVERDLYVTDEHVLSGPVTITVRASDGVNESRDHVGISLQAAPLRLRALFAVGQQGGQTTITRFDSVFQASSWATLPQDLSTAVISSHDSRLAIAGSVNGPLTVLDTETGSSSWQVPNLGTNGQPYFLSMDRVSDGRLVVATGDDMLRAMNFRTGGLSFNKPALPGHRPLHSEVLDFRLVNEQEMIAGNTRQLVVLSKANGDVLSTLPLDLELVAMHSLDDDRMLLFGNRNGDGVVAERNVEFGGGWEPVEFIQEQIIAVVRISQDVYVIATQQGLLRYVYPNNSYITFDPTPATTLAYDAANGLVFAGANSSIRILDPIQGTLVQELNVGHPVNALCALFNRRP